MTNNRCASNTEYRLVIVSVMKKNRQDCNVCGTHSCCVCFGLALCDITVYHQNVILEFSLQSHRMSSSDYSGMYSNKVGASGVFGGYVQDEQSPKHQPLCKSLYGLGLDTCLYRGKQK
jgi:hypothetical protein